MLHRLIPFFVQDVNNFTSIEAMKNNGWSFGWTDSYTFVNKQQRGTYCKDVPSTSYCGFKNAAANGVVSFTFSHVVTEIIQ